MQTQKTLFNPTVDGVPVVDYALTVNGSITTDPIDFVDDTSWALQIGSEEVKYSIFMSNDGASFFPYATLSQTASNGSGAAPVVTAAVDVTGDKMFTDNHFPARYMRVVITDLGNGRTITLTVCK